MPVRTSLCFLFGILALTGCAAPTSKAPKGGDADAEIKHAFTSLQSALKDRNGDKMWDLLGSDSRQDADREARLWKEKYAKADDKGKVELAKKVGLPPAKLQDLTGKSYLESDRFYHFEEHDEVPDVKKLEKIDVKGSTAKVEYKDPDKPENTMRLSLVREEGRWRFLVGIPRATE